MATLDRVSDLQKSGMTDEQISQQLQQEGVAPKEISDALNQAKIKGAVNDNPNPNVTQQTTPVAGVPQLPTTPVQPSYSQATQSSQPQAPMGAPSGMETSMMNTQAPMQAPALGDQYNQQQGQDYGTAEDQYAGYYPETGAYQDSYYQQPMMDTETITQIAEQVVAEKFNNFTKGTGDLVAFKTTTQDKIADMDNRLKRIETTIDKLQQAIIQKIGDFGESNAAIQKDLENLHETTSKLMNPLIDNYRALTEKKHKKTSK